MINVGRQHGLRYMTVMFTAHTSPLAMLGVIEETPTSCRVNLFPRDL